MRPRKRILNQSSFRSTLFSLRIRKLFPCRRKLLSSILVQFPHELSTAMFFSYKELRLSKEEKLYFSNIGPKNRLPHITVYILLRHAIRAIGFTLILLLLIGLLICLPLN